MTLSLHFGATSQTSIASFTPMKRLLLCLLLSGLLIGCDTISSDNSNSSHTLDGPYKIEIKMESLDNNYIFELDFSESDKNLSGSGTLTIENKSSGDTTTEGLDISGSHFHPDVRVNMQNIDGETYSFDGTSKDDDNRFVGEIGVKGTSFGGVVLQSQ